MVEIQLITREAFAAVLTRVVIAGEHVEATETDLPLGNAIIAHEQHDSGYANDAVDKTDRVIVE